MILQINGKKETLDGDRLTVTQLLDVKDVPDPDMVSVQLNGEILEREDFTDQLVTDGDELEFLYFMGGGRGTGTGEML
jgi:sulfur carrier protein